MSRLSRLVITLALLPVTASLAQDTVAQPTGQKTLAATMNVHVFPADGQSSEQQSRDEADCYNWAVNNTGNDPFELSRRAQQQAQQTEEARQQAEQAGKGSGAGGAIFGAAGGALIGEIVSNDPGRGAAWGAGIGLVGGRRARRQAQAKATAQVDQQAARQGQGTQQQIDSFKNSFSVCLEAKSYLVRF